MQNTYKSPALNFNMALVSGKALLGSQSRGQSSCPQSLRVTENRLQSPLCLGCDAEPVGTGLPA